MPNPLKRSYRLDTLKVKDLVMAEAITQEELADKARISRTTLSKSMNGHLASMDTIRRIANALNVEDVQSLIGAETKTENRTTADVEVFIGRSDDEEGILASVRRAASSKKPLVMYLSPAILAMLCCMSGLAPIDARTFYIAGMVLSGVGVALAFSRRIAATGLMAKLAIILPLLALVLNLASYVAWPKAVGFFPVKGGYTFGSGARRAGWRANQSPRISTCHVANVSFPAINEKIRIFNSGKFVTGFVFNGNPNIFTLALEPGIHDITIYYGDHSESKRISMGLDGFPYGETGFTFEKHPDFDASKTNVYVGFIKQQVIAKPADAILILDGKVIDLDGQTDSFLTTAGWHTMTLRVAGKEAATQRFLANPRVEYSSDDIKAWRINDTYWNHVIFSLD